MPPLCTVSPSPALAREVAELVTAARVPERQKPGLRLYGERWGLLALRDLLGLAEAWADDAVFAGDGDQPPVAQKVACALDRPALRSRPTSPDPRLSKGSE